MSESPIELRGKGGGVVFQGTQSPGGGSQPVTEELGGAAPAATIADGGAANVNTQHVSGAALLDYTDPSAPTVLADGVYALTAIGACLSGPQVSGGVWLFQAALQGSAVLTPSATASPLGGGSLAVVEIGSTVIGPISAGDAITFTAFNYSGIGPLDFTLESAVLVKLA